MFAISGLQVQIGAPCADTRNMGACPGISRPDAAIGYLPDFSLVSERHPLVLVAGGGTGVPNLRLNGEDAAACRSGTLHGEGQRHLFPGFQWLPEIHEHD